MRMWDFYSFDGLGTYPEVALASSWPQKAQRVCQSGVAVLNALPIAQAIPDAPDSMMGPRYPWSIPGGLPERRTLCGHKHRNLSIWPLSHYRRTGGSRPSSIISRVRRY